MSRVLPYEIDPRRLAAEGVHFRGTDTDWGSVAALPHAWRYRGSDWGGIVV